MESESAEQRFGEQVRDARESRGWSQEALSRHLRELTGVNIHQSAIARIEGGKRILRFNEATALASVLEIRLGPYAAVPRFTAEDYKQAKAQLVEAEEAVQAVEREVVAARARHDEEQAYLQGQYAARRWELSRLRAGIQAYEERNGG